MGALNPGPGSRQERSHPVAGNATARMDSNPALSKTAAGDPGVLSPAWVVKHQARTYLK